MLQSYTSLFPLIDDPANFFYSKLKTLFLTFPAVRTNIVQKDRTYYKITLSIPSQFPIIHKVDVRDFNDPNLYTDLPSLHPELGKTYLYLKCLLSRDLASTQETTTSGEVIPVEVSKLRVPSSQSGFLRFRNIESLETLTKDRILLNTEIDEVWFLVARVQYQNNEYSLVNCFPNEEPRTNFDYTITYRGMYKPDIGRKWEIDKTTPSTYLDYSWKLYSIDSDYNETLIDSSDFDTQYNYSLIAQPSPFVDHPVNLTFWDRSRYEDPESSLPQTFSFYLYEQEYAPKVSGNTPPVHLSLGMRSEYALYSNHNPDQTHLEWLLSSFHVRKYCVKNTHGKKIRHSKRVYNLFREEWVLALSYILGIDLRLMTYSSTTPMMLDYREDVSVPPVNFVNNITSVLTNPDAGFWELAMESAYPSITDLTYQDYQPPEALSPIGKLVPILQNSLGFTKEVFQTKYMTGYKTLVNNIRSVLRTNSYLSPKGTDGAMLLGAIGDSDTRFIPNTSFWENSVIGMV